MESKTLARIVRLAVIKQWYHSIYALTNTNRPDGLGIGEDLNYSTANQIQALAWSRYCALSDEIRELTKETDLAKYCF